MLALAGLVAGAPTHALAGPPTLAAVPASAVDGPADTTLATPVRGLLVRLRDAPAHAPTAAAEAPTGRRRAAVARADARWRALLAASGLGAEPGMRLEPVGRDVYRVVFDDAHSGARVAHWVAVLARRPEVVWAVPNERETALQAVPDMAPDDPLFDGLAGQWWLQPVGGGDADPLVARLRGVPGFQTAWARTTGAPQVVVAVLDSGITPHPDLDAARLLPGYDMVSDWDTASATGYANDGDGRDADPTDPGDWVDAADRALDASRYGACATQASDWHGTAVTSFLAAATGNGAGVAGALWQGRVLPVRVAGKCGAEVADIVDGMRWAAGLRVCRTFATAGEASQGCAEWAPVNPTPARIVNISFGASLPCNAAYQDAIDELHALGVLVVAAAGNGHGAPVRPASCRGVVAVGALNRDGFKATYSNFGTGVTIATVGGDDDENGWGPYLADSGLLALSNAGATTIGEPGFARHYGTSFAAPIAAGAAALMLAADPGLGPDELVAGLRASARPHVASPWLPACGPADPGRCACSTTTCGAGILDADQAVAWAQARAAGSDWTPPAWRTPELDTPELRQAAASGPDIAPEASAEAGGAANGASGGETGGGAVGGGEVLLLLVASRLLAGRRIRGQV
jgi:serine protease